jgi:nucleotide-binding universal stress UspA family protein
MTTLNHLLVPTDFGEPAERALDIALTIASKFSSKVTLLHAYNLILPSYAEGLSWPAIDLEGEAKKALDETLAKAKERYPAVEAVLVLGNPVRQILEAVEKQGADMIIMGTHGRRWLSRVILGSVADKVVRLSPVPVLTVSAGESHTPDGGPAR